MYLVLFNTISIFYSLLGMLAGRANNDWMEGDIFMNGERIKESFRLQSGFVVQVFLNDQFHSHSRVGGSRSSKVRGFHHFGVSQKELMANLIFLLNWKHFSSLLKNSSLGWPCDGYIDSQGKFDILSCFTALIWIYREW